MVKLPTSGVIKVTTQNTIYTIVLNNDGTGLIQGHPEFCPDFVEFDCIEIQGSKLGLMFVFMPGDDCSKDFITSRVREIEVLQSFPC